MGVCVLTNVRTPRSTFIACPAEGSPDEVLIDADAAVMVGAGLVRAIDYSCEQYAVQYSSPSTLSESNILVMDMLDGGNNPSKIALGHSSIYHMNNTCNKFDPPFRLQHVGGRIANAFQVKQNVVRANYPITRSLFIEAERYLLSIGYPLPPSLLGNLRLPAEFFYGVHANSRSPDFSRVTTRNASLSPIPPPALRPHMCGCFTLIQGEHG
jgi:hypothetical protein